MTIGVVTSAWGTYGQYLPDWVESVAMQTRLPDRVTLIDCGLDDPRPGLDALEASGLPYTYLKVPYRGMGCARNCAVAETDTEWIMHLDADDVLLPHALEDVEGLAPGHDVVSVGVMRGDKEITFPHVSARTILRGQPGCLSSAAYRKLFWHHRPYITVNDYIESALWVGFAHLGARFVATSRPGFVYRQFTTSHSHTLTKREKQDALDQFWRLCNHWYLPDPAPGHAKSWRGPADSGFGVRVG